ncbi:MAG: BglG family transcription antiterminator [Anaerostipes sp.]|nr:BglG family transcription antiterminator [Anaerostipes sp.]
MNKRSREILSEIIKKSEYEQSLSMDDMVERFKVSSRTIRNDLVQINDFLKKNELSEINLGKQGEIVAGKDVEKATAFLKEDNLYSYKMSKDERRMFMIILLTCENTYRTLADIADIMVVSRSTIIHDLDKVKGYFKEHQLYLMSHANKGLLLEGEEEKKRKLLFQMIGKENTIFRESPMFYHLIGSLKDEKRIDADDVETMEKIINMSEHSYGRFLTDTSFSSLKYFLLLSLYRIRLGEFVTTKKEEKNSKYEMAEGILNQLGIYSQIKVANPEIEFLSNILNEIRYIKKTTSNNQIVKMQVITRNFIGRVSKDLGILLQGDYIFYENLINHLESMFETAIEDNSMSFVVTGVLKKYPKVRKIVAKNANVIERYIGRKLSSVEISYIVVHICAAIERNKNERASYSVVIVCNGGIGTSQLLLARLKKYFHFRVVNIIPAHDLQNVDLEDVDIVISTVAIQNAKVDYIQVNPLLNDEDCIRVGEKLATIQVDEQNIGLPDEKQIQATQAMEDVKDILEGKLDAVKTVQQIQDTVKRFFNQKGELELIHLLPKEAITLDVPCEDWRDAIRKSAQYLLENGQIEKQYIDAMIQNVEQNGPYIVVAPGFALPHEELNAGAKKVGLSLIRLKKPVDFGRETFDPVEWVCCLSAINKETHLKAMFHLVNLFHNKKFREDIRTKTSSKQIYDTIKLYEYEMR